MMTRVARLGLAKAYAVIRLRPLVRPYVAHCLARRRARAGARPGRESVMNRPVCPLLALLIERTVVVVATPVRVEREGHDGNAQAWGV